MFLKAFSLEQEPHIIVVMCDNPDGANYPKQQFLFKLRAKIDA